MARLIDEVVGHKATLERLVQLARRKKLPTAMAFVGPEGIGKSFAAKAFADELNCKPENGSLLTLEPSGEWIKVDQVHEVLKNLSLRALFDFRIVLIEQAERLNPQSSNALLKILEEPPENTHFILITSSLSRLLPTIRSRVQSFRFFPLEKSDLKKINPDVSDWALNLSRGQMGELEEWDSEESQGFLESVESILHALGSKDLEVWQSSYSDLKDRSKALRFAKILQLFFRDLSLNSQTEEMALPFSERLKSSFRMSEFEIAEAWRMAFELELGIQQNADRSLIFQNYFYQVHGEIG